MTALKMTVDDALALADSQTRGETIHPDSNSLYAVLLVLAEEVRRLRELVPSPVDVPERGDYVLATKWSDGNPGDPWGVGFYDGEGDGRLFVVDSNRKQIRLNGYRAAARIPKKLGQWLLENAAALEAGALGSGAQLNLWGMLGIAPYHAKRPKRRNGGGK